MASTNCKFGMKTGAYWVEAMLSKETLAEIVLKVREPKGENATFGPIRDLGSHHWWHERENRRGGIFTMRSNAGCPRCFTMMQGTWCTVLHVKLRAVRGNKTKTLGPGAQSTLRAPCSFWNEDVAVTPFPTHSSLFSFTCRHPQTFCQAFS